MTKLGEGKFSKLEAVDPLTKVVFHTMKDLGMSIVDMEARSGISYHQLMNWRRGTTAPRVHDLVACLNVLNLDLAIVRKQK